MGQPASRKEIGAFAYSIKSGKVFVVLITSRKGRWILPKGQPERRLSDKKVALLEAYEEAGVKGKIKKSILRQDILLRRRHGDILLKIYPVKLKRLLGDWPESRFRKRILIRADKAVHKVKNKALRNCIKVMSKRVKQAENNLV